MTFKYPSDLEKTPAGFWRRLGVVGIDLVLYLILYILLYMATVRLLDYLESDLIFDIFWQVIPGFFLFVLLYTLTMEASPLRATVGKLALRLRVFDLHGQKASWQRALFRSIAKLLTLPTAGIAFALCVFRKNRLTLYDQIAGCTVMHVRRKRLMQGPGVIYSRGDGKTFSLSSIHQ